MVSRWIYWYFSMNPCVINIRPLTSFVKPIEYILDVLRGARGWGGRWGVGSLIPGLSRVSFWQDTETQMSPDSRTNTVWMVCDRKSSLYECSVFEWLVDKTGKAQYKHSQVHSLDFCAEKRGSRYFWVEFSHIISIVHAMKDSWDD